MMPIDCDIVIVGSGFGGSILAMVARQLGRRVVLIERGRHPRFAIGESSSPLAGILVEQLAERYRLPRLATLASFGAWQRSHPHLTCGLKRGFTFFRHEAGRRYVAEPSRANQLLVAASPSDALADTHWLRAEVDAWLVDEARALGVDYGDETDVDSVRSVDGGVVVGTRHHGRVGEIRTRGLVDATGPRGLGVRHLGVEERGFPAFPATEALFSHFTGVARCDQHPDFLVTRGPRALETPPYPVDDAAVHHVFDGGWMWVLRFGNGLTSAGVAVVAPLARELRLEEGADAWARTLARYPSLGSLFEHATPTRPFAHMPAVAFRASAAVGPGWVALPSAAAFVDPLFSTGFPLTLMGIERLGRLLEAGLFTPDEDASLMTPALAAYERATFAEADHVAAFIAGCYDAFGDFDRLAGYSMFYFAAASFAEASRRVSRPSAASVAAPSFLGLSHGSFAESLRHLSPTRRGIVPSGHGYDDAVRAAIEPLNVAGLCMEEKANWYGVDEADAIAGASKLGVTADHVRRTLAAMAAVVR